MRWVHVAVHAHELGSGGGRRRARGAAGGAGAGPADGRRSSGWNGAWRSRCGTSGSCRLGLGAARVEPLLEELAHVLTRRDVPPVAGHDADDVHTVVAATPVATGVALGLRKWPEPHDRNPRSATGRIACARGDAREGARVRGRRRRRRAHDRSRRGPVRPARRVVARSPAARRARALLDRQLRLPRPTGRPPGERLGRGAGDAHEDRGGRPLPLRRDRRARARAADAAHDGGRRPDRQGRAGLLRRRVADAEAGVRVARVLTTVDAVRSRFSALQQPLAFFDGPGGTQVPDSVIEAVADYYGSANANTGGAFETSRRTDALITTARVTAAEFLNASVDEVAFGANMTTLNFALTRAAARDWQTGDEIVCTRLDHDGNISPWLELAHDRGFVVRFADVDEQCRLDLDHLRSLLSERTRVVAFPWASNAVGTVTPVAEIAALAHDAGALAWVDAVHYGPHGPIDVQDVGADVVLCSPYKFYGPHLRLAFGRREVLESGPPYKVGPAPDHPVAQRYETGTLPHELLAGFVACVDYVRGVGWEWIVEHERDLAQRFLDGLPDGWRLHGPPGTDDRAPTFAIDRDGLAPAD